MKQILCLQLSQGFKALLYDTVVVYLSAKIYDIDVAIVYSYRVMTNIQCTDANTSLGAGASLLTGSYIATSDSVLGERSTLGIIASL